MKPFEVMSNLNPYLLTWKDMYYVFSEKQVEKYNAIYLYVCIFYMCICLQLYVCMYV